MVQFYATSAFRLRVKQSFLILSLFCIFSFNANATCDNVTSGGTIGSDQSGCSGFDPAVLTSIQSPSGGSGTLQIVWMYRNASTGWNLAQYPGATGLTYDPGAIAEDTYIRRCSRREGCSSYDGESNEVFIDITTCCSNAITSLVIHDLNSNANTVLSNGSTFNLSSLPSSWNVEALLIGGESAIFTWSGGYNASNTENAIPFRSPTDETALNLGIGTYTLNVKVYSQDNGAGSLCDEETLTFSINGCANVTNAGQIGISQAGCAPFDPSVFVSLSAASGGSGTLEYVWIYRNASTGNAWTTIANSNSTTYDAASVTETTDFRRCSRRANCSEWVGESNIISVVITNNCEPNEVCLINNWSSGESRVFWIPEFGTDFTSTSYDILRIEKFSNGHAHITGTIQRNSNTNQKFQVSLWFDTKSTFAQWIAMGFAPHNPDQGDETTWTFYKWSSTLPSTLIGQGALAGVNLNMFNSLNGPLYGLQLGNGAGSIMSTNNGISAWFSYNGTNTDDGDLNGIYECAPQCNLTVNAGDDQHICGPVSATLTATVNGAATCSVPGVTYCNHTLAASGGWLENSSASAVCGDNAGTKLWTQSGNGTSFITIDLGSTVAAGTQICVNMKLEHCSNSATSYSNAKIQASTSSNSGFVNLTSSVTFTQNTYQEYCYTLASAARYIKVLDNGNCAFRVDYVEYTTVGSGDNSVTYAWSGAGIVGATNGPSILVNQYGTFTVTVVDCNGCIATDIVVVDDEGCCTLEVTAGPDQEICGPVNATLTSTVTGASTCTTDGTTDCNHPLANSGGWLESPSNSTVCGDNAGTKLWTQSGNGTSFITLDFGATVPAGTEICVRMKLEHCNNSNTNYSNAKIQASTSANSGFVNLTSSVTFTQNTYQEYCYTLASDARYIKVSDNGNCAFRVDYVEYTTAGNGSNAVTYLWSGPGIINATNGPSVLVNMAGTYTVTVTDCNGCTDSDTVIVTNDDDEPVFDEQQTNYDLDCNENVPLIQPTATDNYGTVTYTYVDVTSCGNDVVSPCDYKTYTQGGWGAPAHGNNPGVYRNANFASAFPSGLTIGCASGNTLTLTSAQAVQDFLPSGSTPSALPSDLINPGNSYNNVLAGQLVAATLNVGFDAYDANFAPSTGQLGNQIIASGTFAGMTINQVLAIANNVIGGCNNAYSYSSLNEVLTGINENFDGGSNGGFITCVEEDYACACTHIRVWTATDACGNTATFTQYFVTGDNEGPTPSMNPQDVNIECGQPTPVAPTITFTDDCGDVTSFFTEETNSTPCVTTIVRTWTATDGCNLTIVDQVITITDTQAPVLNGLPENASVECVQLPIPSAFAVSATDLCDGSVNTESTYADNGEGCNATRVITWTAVDDCGNEVSASRTFSVYDNTDPILHDVPANTTIECTEPISEAIVWATDNCDEELIVSMTAETEEQDCGYLFIRTWSVTDACGNTASASQTITVTDTVDPYVVNGVPAELTIECDEDEPAYLPTFDDNCDEELDLTAISGIGNVTPCGYDIQRAWTATDDCGNAITVYQVIHVVDTTSPTFDNAPDDITVECDAVPAPADVTASDNCHEASVNFNETMTDGCPYTITRTWVANDGCGNYATAVQNITVIDTVDPILIGVPANAVVECSDIPAPAEVTASDICDENVEVIYTFEIIEGSGCSYLIERTWTATDDCGNSVSATQTLEVVDTIDPILIGVPGDVTVECDEVPSAALVYADDNCDEEVDVDYTEVIGEGCPYIITRTWIATDNCYNTTTLVQVITVVDTTYPVLHDVPASTTLECDQPIPNAIVWATDNCDTDMDVSIDANTEDLECGSVFTRTWSVTDDCGNATMATQVITFVDTTDPIILNAPVDINVECSDTIPAYVPMWDDNCDDELTLTAASSIGFDECYTWIHQTYTATDDCGNSTTVVRNINIIDTTAPVLEEAPADATVECSDIPAAAILTATDNCDEEVEVGYNEAFVPGDECTYQLVRTWQAIDECGNTDTESQTLTVTDTTAPVLSGEDFELTLECNIAPSIVFPTATDNCDLNVEIVPSTETIPGDCENAWTTIHTFTAYDNCGNSAVRMYTFHFQDTTDPTLNNVPSNDTVECDAMPAPAEVTADDNCDDYVPVAFEQTSTDGCPYTITRTWTAADNCGNETIATQVLTVIDTTYPVLWNVPANETLECDQVAPAVVVWATDNCTEDLVVALDANTEDLECGSVFTRTWSVTDDCGNTTIATQVITFVDTTDPIILNPPVDINVECSDTIPAYVPMWDDNCDDELTLSAASSTGFDECYTWIHTTYTAIDDCGNATTVVRNINIVDTTAPVLSGSPADATVECSDIPVAAEPTASDNCDLEVDIDFSEVIVPFNSCAYYIVRTWIATDECGNTDVDVQTLTVTDTTNPILIGVPADATVECSNIPAPADVDADDNCDETLEVLYNVEEVVLNNCSYLLIRTWTVTDECNNTTSDSQVLTVVDTTNPYVTEGVPAELTIECDEDEPFYLPLFADNCDAELTVTLISGISNVNPCGYDIERAWTATDDCGNAITVYQVIHVVDTTNPVLVNVPATATVECDEIPALAVVTASDNCDEEVDIDFSFVITEGCPYTITRTWVATDNCGNQSTATQVLTVIDITYPVLHDVPADATLECDQPIPNAVVWATDNCDTDMDVSIDANTDDLECGSVFTRTWSVTDDCGNTTIATQVITFVDTTDPIILNAPVDISVECSDTIPAYVPMWDDNCDEELSLSAASSTGFDECYTWIHTTYTATDDCGNSTTVVRNINIIDTTAPVLSGVPADATVECSDIPAPAEPTASDNCDLEVNIELSEVIVPFNSCTYYIVRTWTATDECGNTDVESQTLTVTDTTAPVLSGQDNELTLECNIAASIIAPTATDNCDENVLIVPSSETIPGDCANEWTEVYTWTAYDNCENSAVRILTIHYQDTTAPILSGVPANTTVECDEIPAPEDVTADDNCDDEVPVTYSATATEGCPYTITRVWTAVDDCGNEVSATQILTVIDVTDPIISGVPESSTIQCGEIPAPADVTAEDNCDDNVDIDVNDVVTSEGCPYTVVRTWTATDNCGNQSTASQTFIVNDTIDPTVLEGVPAELTIECNTEEPFYLPTFTDNCDDSLEVVAISGIGNVTECGYDIARSWTAIDNCGNSVSVGQVIHVVDTTDPTFDNAPADTTVECDEIPAPADVTASDNCHEPIVTFSQTQTEGCPYIITRTWVANDGCGNTATHVQTIYVLDETAPYLTNNPPIVYDIECGDDLPEFNPIFADNCDEDLDITFDEVAVSGNCPGGIIRTWTATDNCDNSTSFQQIIFIHDTTAPVLTGEDSEFTLECNIAPTIIAPTATDACDEEVTVTPSSETIPGDCANEWTVVYTWTAIDDCENESVRTITIHFEDTTAPVLSSYPANATYECTEVPAAEVLTAEDNCDNEVAVIFSEETTDITCGYIITRTWSATDDCGNNVTHIQTISVIDVTNPIVVEGVPAELTIECNTAVPAYTPVFDDNCDDDLTLADSEAVANSTDCGYDIVRTWTATDDCDNSTSVTQVIHVVDSIDPILVGVPSNTEVECDNVASAPLVTATDNCDEIVDVNFTQTATEGCPYTITRTWVATDDCGNSSTAVQTIVVVDTTDPIVVEGVPAELTIECNTDEPFYLPTFDDNCDNDLTVTLISGISNVTDCSYDIERVWTATDNCENSVSVSQTIHVTDTTAPVLTGEDSELTLECNMQPSIIAPTASDNCDENVTIVPSFETIPGDCDNSWTDVYTYTAYDNCGNTDVRTYTFHFQDTTDPTFDSEVSNLTIECGDEIPAPADLTASDNCDDEVAVSFDSFETALDCGYIITRTWTATDNCDNSASFTQLVYILDETAPELFGVPADTTIECGTAIPAPVVTTAEDNCDNDVTLSHNDVILPQDCFYQIKRYYTATDDCGNQTIIPQIITVTDSTDPIIDAPDDVTVACDNIPAPAELGAEDNCDDDVTVSYSETFGEGCPYTIVRTWTATDDCGNSSSATQIVTVIDEVAPVFDAFPPFVNVECDVVNVYTITATDNCDEQVEIIIISEFPVSGACYGSLLRVYQAIDNCGNVTESATQIINVIDTTPPTLIGVPEEMTVDCDSDLPAVAVVTADDNCSEDLVVQFTQTQTNQFCPYDVIRTWSTIDDCGNVTVDQQIIHVTVNVPSQILLAAYPNPADNMFVVKFSMPTDQAVKGGVYDMTGREVFPIISGNADGGRQYEWQMDARTFRAGAYMIMMQVGDEILREKLIVNGGN